MNHHWEPHSSQHFYLAAQADRCAPQSKLNIPASLRPSGAKRFHTMVHDLSLGGFLATSQNRMHIGTICWLTLPGLESLQADVMWWQRGRVSCAFVNLLSPIINHDILSRYHGNKAYRQGS